MSQFENITTLSELEAKKAELLANGATEIEIKDFKTELQFAEAEKKYETAIVNHNKSGYHTYIFICDNGMSCLLKEPTVTISAKIVPYMTAMMGGEPDFVKAAKMLVNECWIAGDAEIRKSEDLSVEVGMQALHTVQIKVAKSKKK